MTTDYLARAQRNIEDAGRVTTQLLLRYADDPETAHLLHTLISHLGLALNAVRFAHREERVPMSPTTCGCGHLVSEHGEAGRGKCAQWWRYPEVLESRPCGCTGVWQRPPSGGSASRSSR